MEDKQKMTEKVGCRSTCGTRVDDEKNMWINDQEWSRSRRRVDELDVEKKMDGGKKATQGSHACKTPS